MNSIEKMRLVNKLAKEASNNGEIPIAAIIFKGNEVISKAYATEKSDGRFLVHGELKALLEADKLKLSIKDRMDLELYTNVEPCMMCLGTAINCFVGKVVYSLDAGSDGAVGWASETWDRYHPGTIFKMPKIEDGIIVEETIEIFKDYIKKYKTGPYVEWAKELICQPQV